MRRLMHALAGLLIASVATPALALEWQSSGVQQVSHQAPARPADRPKVAPKAPTVVRKRRSATPPAPQPPQVTQAAVTSAPGRVQTAVATAPQQVSPSGIRVDTAVQPVGSACGCQGGCECGPGGGEVYYDEQPACGVGGCHGGEPTCGLTYGEPCGCGDIGCCGECDMGCGAGVGCGSPCQSLGVPLMLYVPPIRELTFDGGVHAFKNPLDVGRDRGNFGLNLGVNVGGQMTWFGAPGLGYQIGGRFASSQLHGDATSGTSDSHTQTFFTAGLFRRKPVGLQYGVVYDMLHDERQGTMDFGQIRGLISVTNPRGHEIGFQFTSETTNAQLNGVTYQPLDQYLLFYRLHGCQGGEFRVKGGFDSDSKGIVGADFSVPLTDRWSLETGFTYVIPEEDNAGVGAQEEAWNVGMNMVWHYGCRAKKSYQSPYRPMFRVADNSSLIIDNL
ncbi:hypothetical protein MalM25_14620 [Planctomycetes bacterium MalM25]|nr:hypothetical protein MalM25_14620 [Planctomycetes bacterium MalM25]